jgi:hypothetical protein
MGSESPRHRWNTLLVYDRVYQKVQTWSLEVSKQMRMTWPNTALEATRIRAAGLRVSILVYGCCLVPGASAFVR